MSFKKIKGVARFVQNDDYGDDATTSPFLAAKANPDILSDEDSLMFPERDFDAEEARAKYLENFKKALEKLTPKQRAIVDAMDRLHDQQKAADELGINRVTLAVTLMKIQKKITKAVNKLENGQL